MGGGGAGARDQYGAGAAVGLERADSGLGGVPGRGTDPRTRLGRTAQQPSAVGLGEALRGVEERFVEHVRGPPIAGVLLRGARDVCRRAVPYAGRRASSTRRTGMPSRTGYARPQS